MSHTKVAYLRELLSPLTGSLPIPTGREKQRKAQHLFAHRLGGLLVFEPTRQVSFGLRTEGKGQNGGVMTPPEPEPLAVNRNSDQQGESEPKNHLQPFLFILDTQKMR